MKDDHDDDENENLADGKVTRILMHELRSVPYSSPAADDHHHRDNNASQIMKVEESEIILK